MFRFYGTEVVIDFRLNLKYFPKREVKREEFCDLNMLVKRKLLLHTGLNYCVTKARLELHIHISIFGKGNTTITFLSRSPFSVFLQTKFPSNSCHF